MIHVICQLLLMLVELGAGDRTAPSSCPHCGGDLGIPSHPAASKESGRRARRVKVPDDELAGGAAGFPPWFMESVAVVGLCLVFGVVPAAILLVRLSPARDVPPAQASWEVRPEAGGEIQPILPAAPR